ncbi:MAG: hypothetical protein PHC34_10385 [Candidatus Gastranaerophilales bacterium]|nr:hypothetical protein [Candidatus Gastranaerophilales bacterium]
MKKIYVYFFIMLCLSGNIQKSYSQGKIEPVPQVQSAKYQVEGSLNNFIKSYFKATNDHNLNEISKIYALTYHNGDGLTRADVLKLMKDTWVSYPDLNVNSVIKDIRVNDLYATVETFDKSCGSSVKKSDITNDKGLLENESHNIIYLQKFGKDWKIITDKVLYEKTIIKFGSAKPLKISLFAPEQVLAGENYTASLYAEIPDGLVALGSITREPIVYPETKPDEVFRQVNPATGSLERFMTANTTNNNELATASVGFTEMTEDFLANPELKLTGMAIILTRVNVIPKSQFIPQNNILKIEPDVEAIKVPEKINNKDLKQ